MTCAHLLSTSVARIVNGTLALPLMAANQCVRNASVKFQTLGPGSAIHDHSPCDSPQLRASRNIPQIGAYAKGIYAQRDRSLRIGGRLAPEADRSTRHGWPSPSASRGASGSPGGSWRSATRKMARCDARGVQIRSAPAAPGGGGPDAAPGASGGRRFSSGTRRTLRRPPRGGGRGRSPASGRWQAGGSGRAAPGRGCDRRRA